MEFEELERVRTLLLCVNSMVFGFFRYGFRPGAKATVRYRVNIAKESFDH